MSDEIVYSKVVFVMVEPPSRVISTHKANDRKEHDDLISKAKQKGLYLYRADVIHRDGKQYAAQPWLIDRDTIVQKPIPRSVPKPESDVPAQKDQPVQDQPEPSEFVCKYCSKSMSSSSGLTLHIKSRHPEKLDQPEDDVVDVIESTAAPQDSEDSDELKCPFCDKKVTSTPGRTLHVKNKHPERYEEYMNTKVG